MADHLNGVDLGKIKLLQRSIRESDAAAHPVYSAKLKWIGGLRTEITVADNKTIHVDEPEDIAGSNSAPSPEDLLLAAVGSCHSVAWLITLSAHGIKLNSLDVHVSGPVNFKGAYSIDDTPPGFEHVTVEVRVDADTDRATLDELLPKVKAVSVIPDTILRAVPLTITLV